MNYGLDRDGDVQVDKENPTAGEGGKEDEHRQVDHLEDRKWKLQNINQSVKNVYRKWKSKLRNTNQSVEDVLHPCLSIVAQFMISFNVFVDRYWGLLFESFNILLCNSKYYGLHPWTFLSAGLNGREVTVPVPWGEIRGREWGSEDGVPWIGEIWDI